jgi:YVTN family beta-propeller protein
MKRFCAALVYLLSLPTACSLCGSVQMQAQTPQATELTDQPFFIKKTWTIGGEGNWDYLTMDPVSLQLYIAHGATVQVVDVSAGKLAGEVTGLRDAHGIALDDSGQYGYVSDGIANEVKVFDRRTLDVVATIPTGKNPRAVVFEPSSKLVFAICPETAQETIVPRRSGAQRPSSATDSVIKSTVTVIDTETQKALVDLMLPGKLGFAQADGKGRVYVNITDRNQIAYFDAQAIEARLRRLARLAAAANNRSDGSGPDKAKPDGVKQDSAKSDSTKPDSSESDRVRPDGARPAETGSTSFMTDWTNPSVPSPLHIFRLNQDCQDPKSLALDSANDRLFTACDNMRMQVLNSTNGQVITSLSIGAGTDGIGYDANRGLIYSSNGGGVGSLTIIRQHLTDSYAVIQELPTRARARTLAVNPVSGEVYLVTNISGFDLTHSGGVGDLKAVPVAGSFQVLVIGN